MTATVNDFSATADTGMTIAVTMQQKDSDGTLGTYWNASANAWNDTGDFDTTRKIAMTEGTGEYLRTYTATEGALESYTGAVRVSYHDDDDVNNAVLSGGVVDLWCVAGILRDSAAQTEDQQSIAGYLDTEVAAILNDTGLSIPALIATAQADLDTITGADGVNLLSATQASIDAIETDTTTDIPALIATAQADLDIITGASGVNLLTATQASIDAIEADTNELQADWADGGRLDTKLDGVTPSTSSAVKINRARTFFMQDTKDGGEASNVIQLTQDKATTLAFDFSDILNAGTGANSGSVAVSVGSALTIASVTPSGNKQQIHATITGASTGQRTLTVTANTTDSQAIVGKAIVEVEA